ncbi:hypothetical protein [uncultured Sphingobium sp.]|uniref:hypothetical protein n=1 Tax=uncultured Sphingobium sp. TaxID=316087 RepID=UPI0032B2D79C|tara:strand:+ start:28993 stop:29235 length:243 start_codon:yes stop_codon:yes gene_type:complete
MADTPSAPPLPDGSVDFNAIHAAARQNHDLEKAVAEATFVHPDKLAAEMSAAKAAAEEAKAEREPTTETRPAAKAGSKES